jgi:predicted CopG family antitoxin
MSINEAVNRITNKHIKTVIDNSTYLNDNFDYCYPDLLEMNYNKGFFNDMLTSYSRNMFAITSSKCMNIFLSQLTEKTKDELGLDIQTEFYTGRSFTLDRTNQNVSLASYSPTTKTISINTNAYSELDNQKSQTTADEIVNIFLNRVSMIRTVFHELRHAYQNEKIKEIGTVRDLYFLLDQLLHHKYSLGTIYYENNYEDDSREVDADLYGIVATASLLRAEPEVKKIFWKVFGSDAKSLAKKRKTQQLRNMWSDSFDNDKKSLLEIFNEMLGGYKLNQLAEEYPMLAIISDNGYILTKEELVERYIAVEQELKEELDDATYEEGITILNFLGNYLDIIHNKKMQNKKQRKSK